MLLNAFVLDQVDAPQAAVLDDREFHPGNPNLNDFRDDRRRLAKEVLEFAVKIIGEKPSRAPKKYIR